jgi:hypothetical protein
VYDEEEFKFSITLLSDDKNRNIELDFDIPG